MNRFSVNIEPNLSSAIRSRLEYTILTLNEHPFLQSAKVKLQIKEDLDRKECDYYTIDSVSNSFIVPRQRLVFCDKTEYRINAFQSRDRLVYSVEKEEKQFMQFVNGKKFSFDIFETIFFHISRYEERFIKQGDYLGNKVEFEKQLLLVKNGLEKKPVVDELIEVFVEVVTGKKIQFEKPISLSHDIDYIQKFSSPLSIFRKVAGHFRHRKSILGLGYLWQSYLDYLVRGKDGFDTFDWMLSKKNIDKTIYFLVGGKHLEDNKYDLKGETFQKALKLSKECQYKIGIHPSYESWNKLELIKEQKEKLEFEVGEEIVMSRQHFLNFDISITPKLLQSIGIKEDSSLGYTRHIGYRCGTGFAYRLYDFENEKAFDVVEKPMVFMDVAWLFEGLRNGNLEEFDFSDFYGDFLFHNSTFYEMGARDIPMKEAYLKFFEL